MRLRETNGDQWELMRLRETTGTHETNGDLLDRETNGDS